MKNKNFQILEISTFLRIVCSVLPVSLDCLFFIGPGLCRVLSVVCQQISSVNAHIKKKLEALR
jgi:hypothetical protein